MDLIHPPPVMYRPTPPQDQAGVRGGLLPVKLLRHADLHLHLHGLQDAQRRTDLRAIPGYPKIRGGLISRPTSSLLDMKTKDLDAN